MKLVDVMITNVMHCEIDKFEASCRETWLPMEEFFADNTEYLEEDKKMYNLLKFGYP